MKSNSNHKRRIMSLGIKNEFLKSKKEFQQIFDTLAYPIVVLDKNLKVIYNNQAIFTQTGVSLEQINSIPYYKLFYGINAEKPREDCPVQAALKSKKHEKLKMNLEFYNNRTIIISCNPILDALGEIKKMVCIATDVTEKILSENKLRENEGRFKSIVENTNIVSFMLDKNGIFTLLEGHGLDKFELKSMQLVGQSAFEVSKNLPEITSAIEKTLKGEVVKGTIEVKGLVFDYVYTPIFDENSEVNHIIGVVNDITELVLANRDIKEKSEELEAQNEEYLQLNEELLHANQELYVAKEKAIESDHLKSAFLSNISHEIRTPMNAIIGFSDLLNDAESNEIRDYYVSIIKKSSEHLMSVINDIVDVSKIETGQVEPHYTTVSLLPFITDIHKSMQVTIPKIKNISLELIHSEIDETMTLYVDEVKLRQALMNLITNAIKFTSCGKITFACSRTQNNEVEFLVKDTGIGIKEEHLDKIFDRFKQLNTDKQLHTGSGLGLAISKAYIEMMGGKITVISKENEGSTFTCVLPCIEQVKLIEKKQSFNRLLDKLGNNELIIVAEDDDINYFYLSRLLANTNFKIKRATNGKEVVELVEQNPDTRLVLMDIKMPEMNGYEAARLIQQKNSNIPIVAQTAYALSDDEKKVKDSGFQGYIRKPIKKEALYEVLNSIFN